MILDYFKLDGRVAGRTGLGAVMGSKNLKAVAARGRGATEVRRPGQGGRPPGDGTGRRDRPKHRVARRRRAVGNEQAPPALRLSLRAG